VSTGNRITKIHYVALDLTPTKKTHNDTYMAQVMEVGGDNIKLNYMSTVGQMLRTYLGSPLLTLFSQ